MGSEPDLDLGHCCTAHRRSYGCVCYVITWDYAMVCCVCMPAPVQVQQQQDSGQLPGNWENCPYSLQQQAAPRSYLLCYCNYSSTSTCCLRQLVRCSQYSWWVHGLILYCRSKSKGRVIFIFCFAILVGSTSRAPALRSIYLFYYSTTATATVLALLYSRSYFTPLSPSLTLKCSSSLSDLLICDLQHFSGSPKRRSPRLQYYVRPWRCQGPKGNWGWGFSYWPSMHICNIHILLSCRHATSCTE